MDSKTANSSDLTTFLNVINGTFILHCENVSMLRSCLAMYIFIAKHFQQIFSSNGYLKNFFILVISYKLFKVYFLLISFLLIIPSILKVYSNVQTNYVLKNSVEFACLQFYILHRIPFLLQVNVFIDSLIL